MSQSWVSFPAWLHWHSLSALVASPQAQTNARVVPNLEQEKGSALLLQSQCFFMFVVLT